MRIYSNDVSAEALASQLQVEPDLLVTKGLDREPGRNYPTDNAVVYRDIYSHPIEINDGIHALLSRVGDLDALKNKYPDVVTNLRVTISADETEFPVSEFYPFYIRKNSIAALSKKGCSLNVVFLNGSI